MTAAEDWARQRDGHYCQRCGRNIVDFPSSLHHRIPRQMGGSKSSAGSAVVDRVAGLVRICGTGTTGCHGTVESYRAEAYETGWLVHRNEDPSSIPLMRLDGTEFFLTDEGTVVEL